MSEVPEDIQETAAKLYGDIRDCFSVYCYDEGEYGCDYGIDVEDIDVRRIIASALLAERERCRMIRPEPDIDEATDAYSDGYTEGFADACARFRSAIDPSIWYGDIRPREEILRDQTAIRTPSTGEEQ